ncbi:ethanolamine ammonia-lyase subunit EutB [Aquimarina sp. M1]
MNRLNRKKFMAHMGVITSSTILLSGCNFLTKSDKILPAELKALSKPRVEEDVFAYIERVEGEFSLDLYRQIIGYANEFKEGDQILGLSATDKDSRKYARILLSNTKIKDLDQHSLYNDAIFELIKKTTSDNTPFIENWTLGNLKQYILSQSEETIKEIMPDLSSDVIACVVKLMNNQELISVGKKIFNPLPNSKIGSKGYLSARVQPNSPTDHIDDIIWQVFDAWSYGVGDLMLGTNPVSSTPESVGKIENALYDIISTFKLKETIPNCVLSHIDVQAAVEKEQPETTGIWFQSIAGTVSANKTFDVTIDRMLDHIGNRKGRYGLYAETGQGADFTNGHGEGFDMVIHESRKYGFIRALKAQMSTTKKNDEIPWVFVNDVAGFIGPEVFKTKEQLVRCCIEDTVMGKLHGLCIGLDICSTLHMEVTLEDLNWCIEQIMPANPAYLMALPTKNDPMLSYLTTAFSDHVRIREQFGYKVSDGMWNFFKKIEIIDANDQPTAHFGDPIWVYYQYCLAKNDIRSKTEIYVEGAKRIEEIQNRGVPIAQGYGENIWDLEPSLDQKMHKLYEDAKVSLWSEMTDDFIKSIPASLAIRTKSLNRKDYVYHPTSGEGLHAESIKLLTTMREEWSDTIPDVQIIISDGLNVRALMDKGHLIPFLQTLQDSLKTKGYLVNDKNLVITNGRVRAGYACGEILFGTQRKGKKKNGVIHIIGERPGSGHHNFSAYFTAASFNSWSVKRTVDHDISRVVSGISDTALHPYEAAKETVAIFDQLFRKPELV